jgi:hypothetical protein
VPNVHIVRESTRGLPYHTHRETESNTGSQPSNKELEELYNQIKPTEVFRERELALLKEAENRRLEPDMVAK